MPIRSDAFVGQTIVDAARELLADHRGPLKNAEIVAGLEVGGLHLKSVNPANTVGAVLMRRWKQVGDIKRIGRGMWALAEWQRESEREFK